MVRQKGNSNLERSGYAVPWDARDVITVFAGVVLCGIGFYIALFLVASNYKWIIMAARYVGALLAGVFPYIYVRRKYASHVNLLGLRRGKYRLTYSISMAIGVAVVSAIVVYLFSVTIDALASNKYVSRFSLLAYVIYPISIEGVLTVLIVPVGEEILMRGFLYGYLRKKLGVVIGLLMQSLIFSLFHFGYMNDHATYIIISECYIGLTLGAMYEYTGSIFPAIVCHGIYNYAITIMGGIPFW